MHTNLKVWQESIRLVEDIYSETKSFPQDEKWGIVSQMRRAAVSIPANIAEGSARNSSKEYLQFLYISRASAAELDTLLLLSLRLKYLDDEKHRFLEAKLSWTRKLLNNLIKPLKQ